jgi:type II secretion system protein H
MKLPAKKKTDTEKKQAGHTKLPCLRGIAGFSLLELLTVLLLLGVVAGVSAPAIGRMLEGLDFRQQAGNVMASLRKIRLEAIVQGRAIEVSLQNHSFVLRRSNEEEEERPLELDVDSELLIEPDSIIFSSESTATPALLTLTQGSRSRSISMDPLTAMPVVK